MIARVLRRGYSDPALILYLLAFRLVVSCEKAQLVLGLASLLLRLVFQGCLILPRPRLYLRARTHAGTKQKGGQTERGVEGYVPLCLQQQEYLVTMRCSGSETYVE